MLLLNIHTRPPALLLHTHPLAPPHALGSHVPAHYYVCLGYTITFPSLTPTHHNAPSLKAFTHRPLSLDLLQFAIRAPGLALRAQLSFLTLGETSKAPTRPAFGCQGVGTPSFWEIRPTLPRARGVSQAPRTGRNTGPLHGLKPLVPLGLLLGALIHPGQSHSNQGPG
jgi:hypothetical protein